MLAHGCPIAQLVELVRAGLATARAQRVGAGARPRLRFLCAGPAPYAEARPQALLRTSLHAEFPANREINREFC